jgi:hypothetical protein
MTPIPLIAALAGAAAAIVLGISPTLRALGPAPHTLTAAAAEPIDYSPPCKITDAPRISGHHIRPRGCHFVPGDPAYRTPEQQEQDNEACRQAGCMEENATYRRRPLTVARVLTVAMVSPLPAPRAPRPIRPGGGGSPGGSRGGSAYYGWWYSGSVAVPDHFNPSAAEQKAQQDRDAAAYNDFLNRQAQQRGAQAQAEHLDAWGRAPSDPARIQAEQYEKNFDQRQAQSDAAQAATARKRYATAHGTRAGS